MSINLVFKSGHYAIDSEKFVDEEESSTLLSMLGKSMERMLTDSQETFSRFLLDKNGKSAASANDNQDAFFYGEVLHL